MCVRSTSGIQSWSDRKEAQDHAQVLFAYMSVGFCLHQAVWAAVLVLCMSVSVWNMCSILLLEGQGDMDHNLKSVIVGGIPPVPKSTRFCNT